MTITIRIIFDDIDQVLEEQITRLDPIEESILTWLAIEREAIGQNVLWDNLYVVHNHRDLVCI